MLFTHDNPVTLEPVQHRYFDTRGAEYLSWSSFIKIFHKEFDAEAVSMAMAKGNRNKQLQILDEWNANKENSLDRGNYIHDNLESYFKTGTVLNPEDPQIVALSKSIGKLYAKYKHPFFELTMFSEEHRIAGTSDIVLGLGREKRMAKGDQWVDYFDYKTNISKGIRFTSDYYDNFYEPIEHLPVCEYIKYGLQLSLYAYLGEITWGYRPRRLGIIYIPENMMKWHIIPVPYMKHEVQALFHKFEQLGGADAFIISNQERTEDSAPSGGTEVDDSSEEGFI